MKAKDIMTRDVITVHPETSVEEVGRLFIERHISGAPVIDEAGHLYGIITESDLINRERPFHIPTIVQILDAIIPLTRYSQIEKEIEQAASMFVGQICTREVITVDEETTVQELAEIMTVQKKHLIPVVKEGKIAGIIAKRDIIRAISGRD